MSTKSNGENKMIIQDNEMASNFFRRLIDNYPVQDKLTLKKVLAIGNIKWDKDGSIPTAAVKNTTPITLIFNKQFINEKCQNLHDAVYILSHELTHLILDHFSKHIVKKFKDFNLGYKAMHIIVDAQVNACCHNSLPIQYMDFVKSYYPINEMPLCFMRPDGKPPSEDLQKLHDKLYSRNGITNDELIEGLMEFFKDQQDNLDQFIEKLIGNHSDGLTDKNKNGNGELDDLIKEVGGNILSGWLKEENDKNRKKLEELSSGSNVGTGGPLIKQNVDIVISELDNFNSIKKEISKRYVISPSSRLFKAIDRYVPKYPKRTVVPNFRSNVTVSSYVTTGGFPVFHTAPEIGSKVIVPCYVDVSGSQEHVIPHVLPVIARLKREIGNIVYCFSTVVSPTTITNCSNGTFETTGGTDFNSISKHIIKNKWKQAVILTDGESSIDKNLLDQLQRMNIKITVGWTVKNPQRHPLSDIMESEFMMFD